MFVALGPDGHRVQLDGHAQAAQLLAAGGTYLCPSCREALLIRNGRVLPAHFAHHSGTQCVAGEPESRDHLLGKFLLARWARGAGWQAEFEVYLPAVQQRADVLIRRDDHVQALEFQCAPISVDRLRVRTRGYQRLGIPVQWVLGPRYIGPNIRANQRKFETWTSTRGRELRFVDPARRRMWAWWGMTGAGWFEEDLAPHAHPPRWHAVGQSLALAAQRAARTLAHGEAHVLAVQGLCYARGLNLAGCPVVVHQALSGVWGLTAPEWLLRTQWLLHFSDQLAWTTLDEQQWWLGHFQSERVPLISARVATRLVMVAWHQALVDGQYVGATTSGWRWLNMPDWFADVDRKLRFINSR